MNACNNKKRLEKWLEPDCYKLRELPAAQKQ